VPAEVPGFFTPGGRVEDDAGAHERIVGPAPAG
jgi:hypothetical protein